MIDLVITAIFIMVFVGIWFLRSGYWDDNHEDKEEIEENKIYSDENKQPYIEPIVKIRNINPETVKVNPEIHVYPDSDIETQNVELPENPKSFEEEKPVYANIADYFAGKLNDIPQPGVVTEDKKTESEQKSNEEADKEVESSAIWQGDVLDDEKNARTVILADELIAGDAYVYYRNNLNSETFKGILIADKRLEDDYKNGVVRARYARQAVNQEYKRGFIMRNAESSSLKFYSATPAEISDFLNGCPETKEDLAYILGPYKDKYIK